MSWSNGRRLDKLEALMLPPEGVAGIRLMTTDELHVRLLEIMHPYLDDPEPDAGELEYLVVRAREIEASIRVQVEKRRAMGPPLEPGATPFVVPVTEDGEGDSPHIYPRLMARRAALWERPVVQRILAGGLH